MNLNDLVLKVPSKRALFVFLNHFLKIGEKRQRNIIVFFKWNKNRMA